MLDSFFLGLVRNRRAGVSVRLFSEIAKRMTMKEDNVNHPAHYTSHPSGVECIRITEHHDFCIGSAIKYLWRAGLKRENGMSEAEKENEDLRKAVWYITRKLCLNSGKDEETTSRTLAAVAKAIEGCGNTNT